MVKFIKALTVLLLVPLIASGQAFTLMDFPFVGQFNAAAPDTALKFIEGTTGASQGMTFTYGGASSLTIAWGDGNTNVVSGAGTQSHTYATSGTYTGYVYGTTVLLSMFTFSSEAARPRAILAGGGLPGLKSLFQFNREHSGITNIASGAFSSFTSLTNLEQCWYQASSITNFPVINNLPITKLLNTWQLCTSAANFPEVSNLVGVTSLAGTWAQCSKATAIFPAVNALTNVTSLSQTWTLCSGATNFPDVDKLTNVTTMANAWDGNVQMTNCPAFTSGTNTALTSTAAAFQNCWRLTGNAPTVWDTARFPNLSSHANMFLNCTNLANYASIPAGWK